MTESRPIWVSLGGQNELVSPAWEISILLKHADHVRAFGEVHPGGAPEQFGYALVEGRHIDPHTYLAMRQYVDRDTAAAPVSNAGPDHAADWDTLAGFRDASLSEAGLDTSAAPEEIATCIAEACARLYRHGRATALHPVDTLSDGSRVAGLTYLFIAVMGTLSMETRLVILDPDAPYRHVAAEIWFDSRWRLVELSPAWAAEEGRHVYDVGALEALVDPVQTSRGEARRRYSRARGVSFVSLQDNWQWPRTDRPYEVRLDASARGLRALYPSSGRLTYRCVGLEPWVSLRAGVGPQMWTLRDRWLSVGDGGGLRRTFFLGPVDDVRRLTSLLFVAPADAGFLGEVVALHPSLDRVCAFRLNGAPIAEPGVPAARLVTVQAEGVEHRALELTLDLEREPRWRWALQSNAVNTLDVVNEAEGNVVLPVLLQLDRVRPYVNPVIGVVTRVEQMVRRQPLAPHER